MTVKTAGPAPLALTMGEPAGIGAELALKAWRALRDSGPAFFLLDDPRRLSAEAGDTPIAIIDCPADAAAVFATALPVLPLHLHAPVRPGFPDPANARVVIQSIERAVQLVMAGEASAVVTNPIQKSTLYDAGFPYPGHTEFLGALTGLAHEPVMMLAAPELRVVPVTVHLSLRALSNS